MRISLKTLGAAILAAGLASALAVHGSSGASGEQGGSMMGRGMMNGMMGGMMHTDMSEMMEHCDKMMQGMAEGGSGRPNEQWRKEAPVPEKKD